MLYFLRNPQFACGNRPFPLVAVHVDVHSFAAFPEITGIRGTGGRNGDGLAFSAYLARYRKRRPGIIDAKSGHFSLMSGRAPVSGIVYSPYNLGNCTL